ncbi:MAG: HAMP domain-containing sensor histidine kinase [Lachnospiraceae bacterium]|nr:HAMP domain-containing sensor histidine kinase [Lachnospiraceae bacterium]
MKISIYTKFILIYVVAAILSFVFVTEGTSRMIMDHMTTEKADTLYREAALLSTDYAEDYYRSKTASSLETIHSHLSAIATYLDAEIWMIDIDGKVILDTGKKLVDPEENTHIVEEFDPTSFGTSYYMTGDFFDEFSEETLSVISPINYNLRVRGYLVIHTSLDVLRAEKEETLNIMYITLAALLVISLIALLMVGYIIYSPLKKITRATSEYAAGNLTYQVEVETEDEFGRLADSMNLMAKELNEMEEYERKFVANISHDFRSPLTSIKGYVEAMMDGTIPVEFQEKYFNIVLFEADRLKKLTEELLTLNSFGSKRGMLEITNFDINAVIKNTAASFEGRCTERKISIELLFESWHQPVKADIGKIQQVLYNLIDNAIKFSNDNSSIEVETTVRHEKVFVSVKDHGVGIPKESQKKIWERFYKTDSSRGKDKRGTGLGLAIVKEIIQAHNEHINVISTEGVGTEFTFSLPKA